MEDNKQPGQSEPTPNSVADAIAVMQSSGDSPPPAPQPSPQVGDVTPPPEQPIYRRWPVLAGALAAVLLLIVVGFLLLNRSSGSDKPAGPITAMVSLLDGQASSSSDGETWQALANRSKLEQGDIISTEPGSRLAVAFSNGSVIRLDESTVVKIEELALDSIKLSHQSGSTYNRSTDDDTYEIEINGQTAAGTEAAFQTISTATDKGLRTLYGSVNAYQVTVNEGKQYFQQHADPLYLQKITDISVKDTKADAFLLWNLEQDEKDAGFKHQLGFWTKVKATVEPERSDQIGGSITLTAENTDKGTRLSWTIKDMNAFDGFQIVRSPSSPLPFYGKDEARHVKMMSRSLEWSSTSSGMFSYRVCAYQAADDNCINYSNAVAIEAVNTPPEPVKSGKVELFISDGVINWQFEGTAPHGFHALVSEEEDPVYPGDADYYGQAPHELKLRDSGTYYVRVCKSTGSDSIQGGCLDYSNQVIWIVP